VSEEIHDPRTPIPITFQLHEVIALALLYQRAPDDLDLTDEGVWYGQSVDLALLRIGEALAKWSGNKEMLLWGGALRARIDQEGQA
jgi:hypothetical protein